MFIWDLVSIIAGVIVLIILLAVGYIVLAGLLEGARNALVRSRKERDEQIQKADRLD